MGSTGDREPGRTAGWQIARPGNARQLPGIDMAGFRIPRSEPLRMRAIPHPALTVVIEFGEADLTVTSKETHLRSNCLVAGLGEQSLEVRADGLHCVQVRLSPLAANAVFDLPPAALSGELVSLEQVWRRGGERLWERLGRAPGWDRRFQEVTAALTPGGQPRFPLDAEVAWAWRRIAVSRGRIRVEALADEVGWSRQRLWRRFAAQIGMSPKRAARLTRFDWAIHRLAAGAAPAEVAAAAGYADQSHLHREIRDFAQAAPAAAAAGSWIAADDRAWPLGPPGDR